MQIIVIEKAVLRNQVLLDDIMTIDSASKSCSEIKHHFLITRYHIDRAVHRSFQNYLYMFCCPKR